MPDLSTVQKISHIADDDISKDVVDSAFYVHKQMGPGLLESVYEECLCHILAKRQIPFERQKAIPVVFDNEIIGAGFKADIVVANSIVVEIKSVEKIAGIHVSQIMNYMRLANMPVGLLINFNSKLFRDGIRRFVL